MIIDSLCGLGCGVKIFHSGLVLFFVDPSFVCLKQGDHLADLHVFLVDLNFLARIRIAVFVISFEQFENLLELELTHLSLEFCSYLVLAIDQIVDLLQDNPGFLLGDLLMSLFVGIFFEKVHQVAVSMWIEVVHWTFDAFLIVRVKDGEEQVHQQEKSDHQIGDEEDCVASVLRVGWQHDVGEIRGGQKDEHVEERVVEAGEVLHALDGASEKTVTHPCKVEYVDQDKDHHGEWPHNHAKISSPEGFDGAHLESEEDGADEGTNVGVVEHIHDEVAARLRHKVVSEKSDHQVDQWDNDENELVSHSITSSVTSSVIITRLSIVQKDDKAEDVSESCGVCGQFWDVRICDRICFILTVPVALRGVVVDFLAFETPARFLEEW